MKPWLTFLLALLLLGAVFLGPSLYSYYIKHSGEMAYMRRISHPTLYKILG